MRERWNILRRKDALRSLERFVIGEGRNQGYVFSHPRLSSYFYEEELSSHERQQCEDRFLRWGQLLLEHLDVGQRSPSHAPEYLVQYYGVHLERARLEPERFLPLTSVGWLHAWEYIEGAYSGFLNDVERVWRSVKRKDREMIEAHNLAPHLGQEIRCALIRSSINTLSANIPVELLTSLIEHGVWTATQGLAYARYIPGDLERAHALIAVGLYLSEPQRTEVLSEALAVIKTLRDYNIPWVLADLAPHLPKTLVQEAIAIVRNVNETQYRVHAFTKLIPYLADRLREDVIREAVAAVTTTYEGQLRSIVALAPLLSADLALQVIEVVRLSTEPDRAIALAALAPRRPEPFKQSAMREALEASQQTHQEWVRLETLISLLPHLRGSHRSEVEREALNLLLSTKEETNRERFLTEIAAHLSDPLLQKALDVAKSIEDKEQRLAASIAIAAHISDQSRDYSIREMIVSLPTIQNPETLLSRVASNLSKETARNALSAVLSISDMSSRAKAIAVLAPYLSEEPLRECLSSLRTIRDEEDRAQALQSLATFLPEPEKGETLHAALTVARTLSTPSARARILTSVIPYLTPQLKAEVVGEVLAALRAFGNPENVGYPIEVFADLSPHLSEVAQREALDIVFTISDKGVCADALRILTPRLTEETLNLALEMGIKIADVQAKVELVCALAFGAQELKANQALREKLQKIKSLFAEDFWQLFGKRFPPLIREVPKHIIEEIVGSMHTHRETSESWAVVWNDVWALESVLNSLISARDDEDPEDLWKARVLRFLARRLPEIATPGALNGALIAARMIKTAAPRVKALSALAASLPEPFNTEAIRDALATLRIFRSEQAKVEAILSLASLLPNNFKEEALQILRAIDDPGTRSWGLAAFSAYLAEPDKQAVIGDANALIPEIKYDGFRSRILTEISSSLNESLLEEALGVGLTIDMDNYRAKALTALFRRILGQPRPKAYGFLSESLHKLAARNRSHLLSDLCVLAPAISALGGTNAMTETVAAINDVAGWRYKEVA